MILNTLTQSTVRDNIRGPLSIFANLSRASHVMADKKRVTITPQTFFISNAHQHYTLEVTNKIPTETFNIHFGENFVEKALPGIFQRGDQLLQNEVDQIRDFGFYNRLVPISAEFQRIVTSIQAGGHDPLFLDEKLFELLTLLHHKVLKPRITGTNTD